jgi:putative transcriptional regulator
MTKHNIEINELTGKLLVAMPQMQDPRFDHAVIYICGHDDAGAMGLVLNKLIDAITFENLLNQLNINIPQRLNDVDIHYGGPVEIGRGFVLHTDDYMSESSLIISEHIVLTSTTEILQEIAADSGPERYILALGYAGWGPGQLEDEIQRNAWLQVDVDINLIFSQQTETIWEDAVGKLGIDPDMLSFDIGNA